MWYLYNNVERKVAPKPLSKYIIKHYFFTSTPITFYKWEFYENNLLVNATCKS